MLEAIAVELMMGLLGGTVVGLFGLQAWTGLGKSRPLMDPIKGAAGTLPRTRPSRASHKHRKTSNHSKTKPTRSKARVRPLATTARTLPSPRVRQAVSPAVGYATVQVCPSCHLEAPGDLMEEHLLGSPLHRDGRRRVTDEDDEPFEERRVRESDPAVSGLLRSLLRLLVPPRAFGLRGEERTVDPLRGVVQRPAMFANIPSTFGLVP